MRSTLIFCAVAAAAPACSDEGPAPGSAPDSMVSPDVPADATPPAAPAGEVPSSYHFASRFVVDASSVAYSGQVFRHVLIAELTNYIAGLTDKVDTAPPNDGATLAALNFYFDFDSSTGGSTPLSITSHLPLLQTTFDELSTGADLRSKLAGNDSATDHQDWNTPGNFLGWSQGREAADTPTELVQYWFGLVDDLAYQRGLGDVPLNPSGAPIGKVYVTAEGQDLMQLLQKFLLGAVTLQQGMDDYLDDATEDKGLLSSNTRAGDAPYTTLEHAFDEGFGYFGAARDYGDYTDDELAGAGGRDDYRGAHDSNGDGAIDLLSEYNFGNAVNCAKRDRGSSSDAPTDFTRSAFEAFLAGRHLISSSDGELAAEDMDRLRAHRDTIVATWEACIAATIVHYFNEVIADMDAFTSAAYRFEDHAKHWSELKGFALGLQFNPRSPLLEGTRFADVHQLIGDAPVLPNADAQVIADYRAGLESAREIIAEAYGFAPANVRAW
jgi:hypothetical protein